MNKKRVLAMLLAGSDGIVDDRMRRKFCLDRWQQ